MRSSVKIKSSRNGEITMSFNEKEKSCTNREYLASQICIFTLFAKIIFSQKNAALQYIVKLWQKCHFNGQISL